MKKYEGKGNCKRNFKRYFRCINCNRHVHPGFNAMLFIGKGKTETENKKGDNVMNRQIAINIYKAQVASDSAKKIYEISYSGRINANYDGKDEYIIRAINLIIHKRETGFSFYVTTDNELTERYDRTHYLVYFNFSVKGEWKQISFHSLNGNLKKYLKKGKSHSVEWDRKSSRETCVFLREFIGF